MTEKTLLHPTQIRTTPFCLSAWQWVALLLSPLPLILVHVFGPRVALNLTDSMPRGFYWRSPVTTLHQGQIVIACIPPAFALHALRAGYLGEGTCNGVSTVLKYVAAVGGDDATLTTKGVSINGHLLPGSTPLSRDEQGHAIPHVPFSTYHLTSKQTWLYSPKIRSFDSRYYGLLKTEDIQALAHPILTWE